VAKNFGLGWLEGKRDAIRCLGTEGAVLLYGGTAGHNEKEAIFFFGGVSGPSVRNAQTVRLRAFRIRTQASFSFTIAL
jgi:hypothetical protein